jgi:hypothetical protein
MTGDARTNTIRLLDYWLMENGYYKNHRYDVNYECVFIYGVANIYDDKNSQVAVYRAIGSLKGIAQTQERILEVNMNDPEFFNKFADFLNMCQR